MRPPPFHSEPPRPEPRIEAWIVPLVASLFLIALALIFADVFLGWTEGVVKGASSEIGR